MDVPASYRGREQAFIKHKLLEAYLERLFMIVGQHKAPTICYADCFAGPWQEGIGELEDTSIAISLRIMRRCREGFIRQGGNPPSFRALFIEKDAKAFHKLEGFLASKPLAGVQTHALHGEFLPLRQDILRWCGEKDFAFFFIDPTGWKDVGMSQLQPLLARPNSEYLINFMYNFVNFTLPQKKFAEDMRDLLGEHTDDVPGENRERTILRRYRERLKQAVPPGRNKPRTAYQRILNPQINRPWYHLVYLTRHPRGIQVFAEVSEKLVPIQTEVRAAAQEARRSSMTHQLSLALPGVRTATDLMQEDATLQSVKAFWLQKLTHQPQRFGLPELADILEETNWRIGDLQRGLKELITQGFVENMDAKGTRRKNFVDFEKNERLARVR